MHAQSFPLMHHYLIKNEAEKRMSKNESVRQETATATPTPFDMDLDILIVT